MVVDPVVELGEWYAWFSENEAAGRSPLYAELAAGVAGDRELLAALCELPVPKRQPNLLLSAVRHVCGLPQDWAQFRTWYFERREEITAVIKQRGTQTNEPARCATLLPLLAQLSQPLAILEVGAAAGLCLLFDRYRYNYGSRTIRAADRSADAPVFACKANDPDAASRSADRGGVASRPRYQSARCHRSAGRGVA